MWARRVESARTSERDGMFACARTSDITLSTLRRVTASTTRPGFASSELASEYGSDCVIVMTRFATASRPTSRSSRSFLKTLNSLALPLCAIGPLLFVTSSSRRSHPVRLVPSRRDGRGSRLRLEERRRAPRRGEDELAQLAPHLLGEGDLVLR